MALALSILVHTTCFTRPTYLLYLSGHAAYSQVRRYLKSDHLRSLDTTNLMPITWLYFFSGQSVKIIKRLTQGTHFSVLDHDRNLERKKEIIYRAEGGPRDIYLVHAITRQRF